MSALHVYINGELVELLEDRRLHLYGRYPEGTTLVDPAYTPWREIPLSISQDDYGVTLRKLQPFGHYYAFTSEVLNGERKPVNAVNKYLIVMNLPPHTTAEMLGKFFEQFDFVMEADVLRTSSPGYTGPSCKGRGYVQFTNTQQPTADTILAQCRSLVFYDQYIVYLEGAEKLPPRVSSQQPTASAPAPPPQYHQASFMDNRMPAPAYDPRQRMPGPPTTIPPTAPLPAANNHYYFVTHMYEEHIQTSVRDGIFWPTKVNQRAFYSALERGPVFLIFLLSQRPTLFGYARLTPRDMVRNKHANFTLEWVKHSVFLTEEDLQSIPGVNVLQLTDGTPLKPELGQNICDLVDQFSPRAMPPDLPYTQPPPPAQQPPGRVSGRGGYAQSQQQPPQQPPVARHNGYPPPPPPAPTMIAAPRSGNIASARLGATAFVDALSYPTIDASLHIRR